MSGLAWKLRRLGAMSPSEILHRSRIALRDTLTPPAHELWTPVEAYERLFEGPPETTLEQSRLASLPRLDGTTSAFGEILDGASRLREGRWTLFGHEVRLGDPPDWNLNPLSGQHWPDVSSHKLDYRRADVAGGVKFTWEQGRLTTLPTLALAARLTGEPELADRCVRWLDDWTEQNPLGHGIHHTSGIEMAVRILTINWALALLDPKAGSVRLAASLGLLAQQALHCRDHLSFGSSANNHLLSEYAAMAVMGGLYPTLREGRALFEEGVAGLEREVLAQIHPDGVPAEQAFGYLPFIWELLLTPFVVAELAGRKIGERVRDRLRESLEFARALRLPNGRLPSIGDEDDARVLMAESDEPRLDLVGNALAAWLEADALAPAAGGLARLLVGARPRDPRGAADGERVFRDGGYTVWRVGDQLVTFDHGPLGYPSIAAHGHADALSVTVHQRDAALVADPGTFAYHGDRAARDRCRSTPVHATVHFGGRSQSEMLGPFMWGRRATVRPVDRGFECRWWSGERHWRAIEVEPGHVVIHDRVQGESPVVAFPLAPGARVEISGRRATVRVGTAHMVLSATNTGEWRTEPAEHAPRFGHLEASQRLVAAIEDHESRVKIEISE